MLRLKSIFRWIREGDANSRIFHSFMKKIFRRNDIMVLILIEANLIKYMTLRRKLKIIFMIDLESIVLADQLLEGWCCTFKWGWLCKAWRPLIFLKGNQICNLVEWGWQKSWARWVLHGVFSRNFGLVHSNKILFLFWMSYM